MLECHFVPFNSNERVPYVRELISYNIDSNNNNNNFIEYIGHFYNEKNVLPITAYMFLLELESKPYKIEDNISYYNKLIDEKYIVEIYKKESIEDISKYFLDNNTNNIIENSCICLTPLYKERVSFKIKK